MTTTRIILGLSLGCLLLSMSAMGQTTTSTIQGTVTDANAAVVQGAEVKARGTTLAVERTTTTDEDGFYRLTALPAGTYTLTTTLTGFAPSTSNIDLTLNRVVTVDVRLQVGDVRGEVVNVGDVLPLLNTNAPSTGLTITPRQITELPVNGRDYLDLLQLVPGVAINRQANPEGDNATPVLGERRCPRKTLKVRGTVRLTRARRSFVYS